jgi:hypothetical protein
MVLLQLCMTEMNEKSESGSVAAILERELEPTVREWLRRVNLISELTDIPLSDADRSGHLTTLYSDLIYRLRLPNDTDRPISVAAGAHGQRRQEQGYSAAMLIEESPIFQIISDCHIPNIASPSWRTRPETVASRRDCHRGRGGRATPGSGTQVDNKDALPATASALDCKNAGAFSVPTTIFSVSAA